MLTSQKRSPFVRRAAFAAVALAGWLALSTATVAAPPPYDLGDAPDSTNHFGAVMNAYGPGSPAARYPTVFDPATGPVQGPLHANINGVWLGQLVTCEQEADLMPDCDGITNIDPPANANNRDKADDGVPPASPTITLPQCGQTQFRYIVTGAAAPPLTGARVNVWFDWNRDGDWEDTFTCTNSTGAVLTVPEWAVQNQGVPVVAGSVVRSTPIFNSGNFGQYREVWMRISIADQPAPLNPGTGKADGRGPNTPYKYGETEDYFTVYVGPGANWKPQ
ncbi:MAG TPA: GEVED domain-containing protein [Roseiflexaceae bacterium]|nr:GEVED domain-containing protein [Roseiflexaceae bacterium]